MKNFVIVLFVCLGYTGIGQSQFPEAMNSIMLRMQLEYIQPVERKPEILPKGKVKYFEYDFGFALENGKTLVLVQTRKHDINLIPQITVTGMVSTLATNSQEVDIMTIGANDNYIQETNCDWALEALFTPKDDIGPFGIAHLKSLFKDGVGMVNILYLGLEDVETLPLLRFRY